MVESLLQFLGRKRPYLLGCVPLGFSNSTVGSGHGSQAPSSASSIELWNEFLNGTLAEFSCHLRGAELFHLGSDSEPGSNMSIIRSMLDHSARSELLLVDLMASGDLELQRAMMRHCDGLVVGVYEGTDAVWTKASTEFLMSESVPILGYCHWQLQPVS
jgi:hypothetical protein